MRSISRALLTWYGISLMTIDERSPFFDTSISTRARMMIMPRPVR